MFNRECYILNIKSNFANICIELCCGHYNPLNESNFAYLLSKRTYLHQTEDIKYFEVYYTDAINVRKVKFSIDVV